MAEEKVVINEMSEQGNLASLYNLGRKWLGEYELKLRDILAIFHQIRKEDFVSFVNGASQIQPIIKNFGKFIPTYFFVNIPASGSVYHYDDRLVYSLVKTKADGGLFDRVDKSIFKEIKDTLVSYPSFIHKERLLGAMYFYNFHGKFVKIEDIVKEGRRLGFYRKYHIVEALLIANSVMKEDVLKKCGCGIDIYLDCLIEDGEDNYDILPHLRIFKDFDDKISLLLQSSPVVPRENKKDFVIF